LDSIKYNKFLLGTIARHDVGDLLIEKKNRRKNVERDLN